MYVTLYMLVTNSVDNIFWKNFKHPTVLQLICIIPFPLCLYPSAIRPLLTIVVSIRERTSVPMFNIFRRLTSRPGTSSSSMDSATRIDDALAQAPVVVFSKTYCGFCRQVLQLLSSLNVDPYVLQLDRDSAGRDIQNKLFSLTSSMTVPSVWIGGKYIGGCDSTKALHSREQLIPAINAAKEKFNKEHKGREDDGNDSAEPSPTATGFATVSHKNEDTPSVETGDQGESVKVPISLKTSMDSLSIHGSTSESDGMRKVSVSESNETSSGGRIDAAVTSGKVVIFAKSYCPYSTRVKKLFAELQIPTTVMDLDHEQDGEEIQGELKARTGVSTVPSVWINGKYIGGCDDTHKLHESGQLSKLLDDVQKPSVSSAQAERVESFIHSKAIVIFAKSYCPYCKKVKALFSKLNKSPAIMELDLESDGDAVKEELKSRTGCGSVPSVWIGGKYIGGCDDTHNLHDENKLEPLISASENQLTQSISETNPSAKVEALLASSPVVVFSKSYCPYSQDVKNLFSSLDVSASVLELDKEADGEAIHDELKSRTNVSTVPSVWIHGKYIGGCDATMDLHETERLVPLIGSSSESVQ